MATKRSALIGIATVAFCSTAAHCETPIPICGQPAVLAVVAQILAKQGIAAHIESQGYGQIPTEKADLVRCAVRLHNTEYDTNNAGTLPILTTQIYQYSVRTRANGWFVDPGE